MRDTLGISMGKDWPPGAPNPQTDMCLQCTQQVNQIKK